MEKLKKIMARVMEVPEETITAETSRINLETWDSFNHLALISEVEKELGVSFTMEEVEKLSSFDHLCKLVTHKNGTP